MEELYEEYGTKSVIPYINLEHTFTQMESGSVDPIPWLNVALSLQSLQCFSSMFVLQGCHSASMTKNVKDIAIPNVDYKVSRVSFSIPIYITKLMIIMPTF